MAILERVTPLALFFCSLDFLARKCGKVIEEPEELIIQKEIKLKSPIGHKNLRNSDALNRIRFEESFVPLADKIRGKKKKTIEGDMVIDNPDIKVATVSHEGKPFVVGIGTTEERQVEGEAAVNIPTGGKGKYQTQKTLKWKILYDPNVFPDLMPLEELKNFAASSVAVTSGSIDVYRAKEFEETKREKLRSIENKFVTYKGNDPLEVLWEFEHIKPISKGGSNKLENLRVKRKKNQKTP